MWPGDDVQEMVALNIFDELDLPHPLIDLPSCVGVKSGHMASGLVTERSKCFVHRVPPVCKRAALLGGLPPIARIVGGLK